MMNNTYFIADAHLGSWAIKDTRDKERHLVAFLDTIKDDAKALYILGDMFDFWYEYRYTVPRGYTRFLGKLSELTDRGVEVHFLVGNHDQWMMHDYLHKECGVTVHTDKLLPITIGKKHFCLAHGDGLDNKDKKYLILRSIFHNKVCQWLFSALHPRWGISFGLQWAKHSYIKHKERNDVVYLGEDKEHLVRYAREYIEEHPNIDYFLFGHRHIELDIKLERHTRLMILGDWISQFTYAVYDGEHMFLEEYVEGESQP